MLANVGIKHRFKKASFSNPVASKVMYPNLEGRNPLNGFRANLKKGDKLFSQGRAKSSISKHLCIEDHRQQKTAGPDPSTEDWMRQGYEAPAPSNKV